MRRYRQTIISRSAKCALSLVALSCFISANTPAPPQTEQLVKLNVILTDRSGHSVDDVVKEDLQLLDDGTPEAIAYFSKAELPITYGLVMDMSGSLRRQFSDVIEAGRAIVGSNKPHDQTFIVRFASSDKVEMAQEMTSDKDVLSRALGTLFVRPGQTAVIDGLCLAADYAIKHRRAGTGNRLALVLISDGEDRASYYTESDLFKLLDKGDLQVFVIGLVGELDDEKAIIRKSPRSKAIDFLTKLARATGGRAFILNSVKGLPDAISQVTHDLHTQYVIGYQPTKNPEKTNRKVEVKVVASRAHEKWTAITRRITGAKN